jgi:hypothetical protein
LGFGLNSAANGLRVALSGFADDGVDGKEAEAEGAAAG